MKVNHKITGAEREVMEVLWRYSEPVQTKELLEQMKEKGRNWKRQTLNTLLFRLEEKGIVNRRRAYVQAALSEEELLQLQTQEILDDFYGGKYGNFFAALTGRKTIDSESEALLDSLMNKLKKQ
ncbi:MAG: BlaI/MecI/CopY family transcriptional regulator [Lachnospiraceae bacterium]|uniref:BlaI/MecI/CopY family transcriptional regulator n=1 Tax=uncultured Acetatifactor sp. TaxID=1671927 RepID=UPI002613E924|nr:BlaI/MecI/CopY family transcriptional regulator [uncultured Acetatifactor sp.]MCI8788257.1 BlaI/MecI/CopY family transcriptional regulator [Lachnospiraceae bacterium]